MIKSLESWKTRHCMNVLWGVNIFCQRRPHGNIHVNINLLHHFGEMLLVCSSSNLCRYTLPLLHFQRLGLSSVRLLWLPEVKNPKQNRKKPTRFNHIMHVVGLKFHSRNIAGSFFQNSLFCMFGLILALK